MKITRLFSKILCCILVCLIFLSGCSKNTSESASETLAGETSLSPQLSASEAALDSEPKYTAREGLQTILFIGLDKFEAPEQKIGYLNDQQADFLMLFVLDEENQVCDVIHLNRDTMTEIRRLGIGGGVASRFTGQLALSHTYGSGGSDSCLNTCKAVSTLLKGVKIDHYVAMTMAGVSKLNDLVGGVEVEIPVDMTSVDPAFVKGEKILLKGEQALLFIRSRGSLEDSSNLSRMERQRAFLTEFYQKLLFTAHEDHDFINRSLLEMTSYIKSDMTVNQMSALAEIMEECKLNPFISIDGEAVVGDEFMEFYVDEDSLNQVLISLFTE